MDPAGPLTTRDPGAPRFRGCAAGIIRYGIRVAVLVAAVVAGADSAAWWRATRRGGGDELSIGLARPGTDPAEFTWLDVVAYRDACFVALQHRRWPVPGGLYPAWWGESRLRVDWNQPRPVWNPHPRSQVAGSHGSCGGLSWRNVAYGAADGSIRERVWALKVPHWLILSTTGLPPVVAAVRSSHRRIRRTARAQRGQCLRCGYDLRGVTGRCPECGEPAAAGASPAASGPPPPSPPPADPR
jgi:hypothetical protein